MKPHAHDGHRGSDLAWEVLTGLACAAAVLLVGWVMEGQASWGYAALVAVGITAVSVAQRSWRRRRQRRTGAA